MSRDFIFRWEPEGSAVNIDISAYVSSIGKLGAFRVKQFVVPVTWYGVSSINNGFTLSETDGADTSAQAGTLTPGNYSLSEFVAELKIQLDAISANGRTYTVTGSTTSGKITITSNTGEFEIAFNTDSRAHSKLWGVAHDSTSPQISSSSSIWTSPKVVQLWGPDIIRILSTAIKKLKKSRNVDTGSAATTLISMARISSGYFTQSIYEDDASTYYTIAQNVPNTIDFDIEDEEGNSIDCNGATAYLEIGN